MVKRIDLGGKYDTLCVYEYRNKYEFYNGNYGMELTLYREDIGEYLSNQNYCRWGLNSRSNTVSHEDQVVIRNYLLSKMRKYKTVTDVLKSRSKRKEKILREDFSLNELVEYKIGKEKANG